MPAMTPQSNDERSSTVRPDHGIWRFVSDHFDTAIYYAALSVLVFNFVDFLVTRAQTHACLYPSGHHSPNIPMRSEDYCAAFASQTDAMYVTHILLTILIVVGAITLVLSKLYTQSSITIQPQCRRRISEAQSVFQAIGALVLLLVVFVCMFSLIALFL